MTTFFIIRHAHATWTPDENRPLSERGQRDAQRVAELLDATAKAAPIAALYASTARRAQQTVAPLAARLGLPQQITPALDERRLSATPVPVENFEAAVRATWDDFTFAHPGGETNAAAQERGLALVHSLVERHPDQGIVLGTHGNLLALIVQGFFPAHGYRFWQRLTMPDVYRLDLPAADRPARAPVIERLWIPGERGPRKE
jgi:2,3-bisphosphoglycerate-dependent phosphoglycerate mutase